MTVLKITFLLLITLFCSVANAQTANNLISIGQKAFLYSKVLEEEREVWVHVPRNLTKSQTTERFPVVYVLDGDQHFHALSGLIHQLSATNGNTICPEMIVVAILNTDRTRDLTVTHKTTGFAVDPEFAKNSGGGEKFTSFIEKELFAFVDSLYPTAPYRMLVGHSLGGMMVVNTLLNHTEMFNSYVALDPSLWWDEQLLVKQAQTRLNEKKFANRTFYMAVANTMNSTKAPTELRKDTHDYSLPLRSQLDLADVLTQNKENSLKWHYDYYPKESHTSVPLIGEYNALHFIFDFHKFTSLNKLFDPGFDADSALTAHYKMVTARLGYSVLPPEEFVNGLGHAYLESKLHDKSEGVFKLNLANYPQSTVVYAAMGDLYTSKGDRKTALSYYQRALGIKKDPELQKKVNALALQK
jgi:predicted alpha/beta superfamily hydrolase